MSGIGGVNYLAPRVNVNDGVITYTSGRDDKAAEDSSSRELGVVSLENADALNSAGVMIYIALAIDQIEQLTLVQRNSIADYNLFLFNEEA